MWHRYVYQAATKIMEEFRFLLHICQREDLLSKLERWPLRPSKHCLQMWTLASLKPSQRMYPTLPTHLRGWPRRTNWQWVIPRCQARIAICPSQVDFRQDGDLVEVTALVQNYLGALPSIDLNRSETASISSSLFEHVEENGRTYHKYKEGSKSIDLVLSPRNSNRSRIHTSQRWGKSFELPACDRNHFLTFSS